MKQIISYILLIAGFTISMAGVVLHPVSIPVVIVGVVLMCVSFVLSIFDDSSYPIY